VVDTTGITTTGTVTDMATVITAIDIIGHTTATATGTMPRDPTMAGMAMVVLVLALASAAVDTAAGNEKPAAMRAFFLSVMLTLARKVV